MHKKLATITEWPDAIVIFSGHNEFLSRFSFANRVIYYADERPERRLELWLEGFGDFLRFTLWFEKTWKCTGLV